MTLYNYNIIIEFLRIICDDIPLKGVENINHIDIEHERCINYDNEGNQNIIKEYVVYTSGINIEKLRYMKGIDFSRTICNDILTILRLYGIEAARQILIHELTVTYQANGSNINHAHISLLVDQMCHLGEITSIDRHGLSKMDIDPITKASFEKTMDHFINAAIFNEKDYMRSVSSCIALGKVIPGGTGCFELLLDTDKIINSEYNEDEINSRITFLPLEEELLLKDIIKYGSKNYKFFMI